MKTAGELLRETRLKKELTIKEIAKRIKVKSEYLEALENNDFNTLPSATFTKGFLRNYAQDLKLKPETVIAMFRRDFVENETGRIIPKGLVEPINKRSRTIPINAILIGVAFASFLAFLSFQLINYFSLPKLEVIQPINGETYAKKITVKGKTEQDAVVTINNQKVIVAPEGEFTLDLIFPSGTHSIIVQSTNRQEKTRLIQRTFQITD